MSSALRFVPAATVVLALVAPMHAQSTVTLNTKATYLHVNSDAAANGAPLALAAFGVAPGDCVRLRRLGDYDNGPGGDTFQSMIGVFSASATLLGPSLLHRVPDALDAGADALTSNTYFGNQPTDIPEDFLVSTAAGEVTVKVPAGATHLFLSTGDQLFNDNSDPDGDYGVEVTLVGCWTDLGSGLAGAGGTPLLTGAGTLLPGAPVTLTLTGAKASSSAALIVGFGLLNAPFKGGTLVPTTNLVIAGLPTDAAGALTLPATGPVGLPSGFSIHFQTWIVDATGPQGFTASNGLTATTP